MFDFAQLHPDPDKLDGVWTRCLLPIQDGKLIDTGVDLLIAYAFDNEAFENRQASLVAEAQRANRNQPLDELQGNRIIRRASAGPVLKDWKNYVLNGQEVPFSQAEAEKALLSSFQFAQFVARFAGNLSNYRTPAPADSAEQMPANPDDGEENPQQDTSLQGSLSSAG